MEKIICNNKLKKLLISILVVMILMSYVYPIKVFAATIIKEGTYSYFEWTTGDDTKEYSALVESAIRELLKEKFNWNFLEDKEKEDAEFKIDQILSKSETLMVPGKCYKPLIGSVKFELTGDIYNTESADIEEKEMGHDDLVNWLGLTTQEQIDALDAIIVKMIQDDCFAEGDTLVEGTPEQVAQEIFRLYKDDIIIMVSGDKTNYRITGYKVPGKSESELEIEAGQSLGFVTTEDADEDSANLGGILLSPVFWLINFIADAITSNVGNLMVGNGLSLVTGFKVLKSTPDDVPSGLSADEYVTISTNSFVRRLSISQYKIYTRRNLWWKNRFA